MRLYLYLDSLRSVIKENNKCNGEVANIICFVEECVLGGLDCMQEMQYRASIILNRLRGRDQGSCVFANMRSP